MSAGAATRTKAETRFYWSLRLTLAGLVVELGSLFGLQHPLGFMAFAAFGCTLVALGVVLFFISLFAIPPAAEAPTETE